MSGSKQRDLFFDDLAREAYRRWQRREEANDNKDDAAHNRLLIENGDPELERVIAALEQGWTEGR